MKDIKLITKPSNVENVSKSNNDKYSFDMTCTWLE